MARRVSASARSVMARTKRRSMPMPRLNWLARNDGSARPLPPARSDTSRYWSYTRRSISHCRRRASISRPRLLARLASPWSRT